jgi:glutaredoxin
MSLRRILGTLSFPLGLAASLAAGYYATPVVARQYHRWFPPPAYATDDHSAFRAAAGQPVVLFSNARCPWCLKTRQYLQSRGISYREYVVDESAEAAALYARLETPAVPVLLIGDRRIVGYREAAFADALAVLENNAAQ